MFAYPLNPLDSNITDRTHSKILRELCDILDLYGEKYHYFKI